MGIPMSCVQIMGKSLLPGDVFPREEFPTTNQQAAQHTRSTTAAHGMSSTGAEIATAPHLHRRSTTAEKNLLAAG